MHLVKVVNLEQRHIPGTLFPVELDVVVSSETGAIGARTCV
jgi:hypothetical protein